MAQRRRNFPLGPSPLPRSVITAADLSPCTLTFIPTPRLADPSYPPLQHDPIDTPTFIGILRVQVSRGKKTTVGMRALDLRVRRAVSFDRRLEEARRRVEGREHEHGEVDDDVGVEEVDDVMNLDDEGGNGEGMDVDGGYGVAKAEVPFESVRGLTLGESEPRQGGVDLAMGATDFLEDGPTGTEDTPEPEERAGESRHANSNPTAAEGRAAGVKSRPWEADSAVRSHKRQKRGWDEWGDPDGRPGTEGEEDGHYRAVDAPVQASADQLAGRKMARPTSRL
ncbi:hypothetical protein BDY17DRAFT_325290 [Neohortaea acidophila]|uniref:Uncharacterized protein n=1 Tax=Neohortaea acidophila TaxID=245834 RepID=A0A6A6PPQ2_9PEZI|nr:uncharacterized protein BDY17DRAFT_325290 [Neohortaea acidophila]KAF2481776.1 hypothetical protein BDY17DRAFT_325290 [Neohortaea acidophila]